MKTIPKIITALVLSGTAFISAFGQKNKDREATISNMVASQQYVFKAQYASPMSMPNRNLTSDYDLTISRSAIISYLPYFGRAYVAPIDPTKGGLMFTSHKFQYTQENDKKGGWDITIVPNDETDVQKLYLHISPKGYGTLQVTSRDRQPISFNGYIEEYKQPKRAF